VAEAMMRASSAPAKIRSFGVAHAHVLAVMEEGEHGRLHVLKSGKSVPDLPHPGFAMNEGLRYDDREDVVFDTRIMGLGRSSSQPVAFDVGADCCNVEPFERSENALEPSNDRAVAALGSTVSRANRRSRAPDDGLTARRRSDSARIDGHQTERDESGKHTLDVRPLHCVHDIRAPSRPVDDEDLESSIVLGIETEWAPRPNVGARHLGRKRVDEDLECG
jgi:hypothetical protein